MQKIISRKKIKFSVYFRIYYYNNITVICNIVKYFATPNSVVKYY